MIREQYGQAISFLRSRIRGSYWRCVIGFVVLMSALIAAMTLIDIDTLARVYGDYISAGASIVYGASDATDAEIEAAEAARTWGYYVRVNGKTSLVQLVCSLIPFVPVGAISLVVNALVLGFTTALTAIGYNANPVIIWLVYVAPHGIAEYSNGALEAALAIYMSRTVTCAILHKEHDDVKEAFLNILRVWILIVIPVIIICGFVEANITPLVINLYHGV